MTTWLLTVTVPPASGSPCRPASPPAGKPVMSKGETGWSGGQGRGRPRTAGSASAATARRQKEGRVSDRPGLVDDSLHGWRPIAGGPAPDGTVRDAIRTGRAPAGDSKDVAGPAATPRSPGAIPDVPRAGSLEIALTGNVGASRHARGSFAPGAEGGARAARTGSPCTASRSRHRRLRRRPAQRWHRAARTNPTSAPIPFRRARDPPAANAPLRRAPAPAAPAEPPAAQPGATLRFAAQNMALTSLGAVTARPAEPVRLRGRPA